MHIYSFEKLEIWQQAKKLVISVYELTETFPNSEKFGMVSQIRRSAASVPANIAEGTCRNTPKDQAYFYGTAYSSLIELLNHLMISSDLKWIKGTDLFRMRSVIERLSFNINSLRKSVLNEKSG